MSPGTAAGGAGSRVAVVVPAPSRDRTELMPDEQVSLRHLLHHLGRYDRYLVVPEGSDLALPGFRSQAFPHRYFGGIEAHGQLLLSPGFYEAFLDYEYILVHHLDALVLSDRLLEWCDRGFDYVGPPLLVDDRRPEKGFMGVGNGGFSLRRVRSLLRAMESRRYQVDPEEHWRKHYAHLPLAKRLPRLPHKYLKRLSLFNGFRWEASRYVQFEDLFWAKRGAHYDPELRFAPVADALRFGFDRAPRYCFQQAGGVLPFGCHGWFRYDREFWEPYLLPGPESVDGARQAEAS